MWQCFGGETAIIFVLLKVLKKEEEKTLNAQVGKVLMLFPFPVNFSKLFHLLLKGWLTAEPRSPHEC